MSETNNPYENAYIEPLSPVAHARKRPGMYIGGIDLRALHELIEVVFADILHTASEATVGNVSHVEVILNKDGSIRISDNGSGLPVDQYDSEGVKQSILEVLLTQNGSFSYTSDKLAFHSTLMGTRAVVAALSDPLWVEIKRDGYLWQQEYRRGEPQNELTAVRPLAADEPTGTSLTFLPDFTIFEPNPFNYTLLYNRLRELAFLLPGLTLTLEDQRVESPKPPVEFRYQDGVGDFVRFLNRDQTPLHDVIHVKQTVELEPDGKRPYSIDFDIALQYTKSVESLITSYVNMINVEQGGTHIHSFVSELRYVLEHRVTTNSIISFERADLVEGDVTGGLTAVVNIHHPYASFESLSRVKLLNTDVTNAIYGVIVSALNEFADEYPEAMARIVDKVQANKARRIQRRYG